MIAEESKLVNEALRDVEYVLTRKGLTRSIRFELQCAKEKLTKALNWGEDETPAVDD